MFKIISTLSDVMVFIPFWMVAPEIILGEKKVRSVELAVLNAEPYMPRHLMSISGTFIGLVFPFPESICLQAPIW